MTVCLNCEQEIIRNLSLSEVFSLREKIDRSLCSFCQRQLIYLPEQPHCKFCYKVFNQDICDDCRRWQESFNIVNQHAALYQYNAFMHDYFKKYKRYNDVLMAQLFQPQLSDWAKKNLFDVVTYIPSSPGHLTIRGFDPVKELYKNIFDLTPMFYKEDADKPQAQKNRQQRMLTPQTFNLIADFPKISYDSKILIVDDIYTTGRTIMHARQCLASNGFQNIYTFSLSR